MAELANSLSQELWDRATSGGRLDREVVGFGAGLLSESSQHAAVLQLQASECGCADPVSVGEARDLSELLGAHLRSLAERKAEGQGMDMVSVVDSVRIVMLAIAHARRLQFQEASAGAGVVSEAVGLAKQLGGHLQMVVMKASKRATADASLVSNMESYAAVAEAHAKALMAINRPSSTPDAAIALACVVLTARTAYRSALLQFCAAGSMRAPRDLASGAAQLQALVASLKLAIAGRLEAKGALDEDSMTRLEDIEVQTKVQEDRLREVAKAGTQLSVKFAAEAARVAAKAASLSARVVSRVTPVAGFAAGLLTGLQGVSEQLLGQAELLKSMARNNAQLDVSTAVVALEGARAAYQAVEQLREHLQRVGGERCQQLKPEVVREGLQLSERVAKLTGEAASVLACALQATQAQDVEGALGMVHLGELAQVAVMAAQHARVVDSQKLAPAYSKAGQRTPSHGFGALTPSLLSATPSTPGSPTPGTPRTPRGGSTFAAPKCFPATSVTASLSNRMLARDLSSRLDPSRTVDGHTTPGGHGEPGTPGAGQRAQASPAVSPANAVLACSSSRLLLYLAQGLADWVPVPKSGGGEVWGAGGTGSSSAPLSLQQHKQRVAVLVSLLSSLACSSSQHSVALVLRAPPGGAVPLEITVTSLALAAEAAVHALSLGDRAASRGRVDAPSVAAAVALSARAVAHAESLHSPALDLLVASSATLAAGSLVDWTGAHAALLTNHASTGIVTVDAVMVAAAAGAAARAAALAVLLNSSHQSSKGGGGGAGGGAGGAGAMGALDGNFLASAQKLQELLLQHLELVEREVDGKKAVGLEVAQQAAELAQMAAAHSKLAFTQSSVLGLPEAAAAAAVAREAAGHADLVMRRWVAPSLPLPVGLERKQRQQLQQPQLVTLGLLKSAQALAASLHTHVASSRAISEPSAAGSTDKATQEGKEPLREGEDGEENGLVDTSAGDEPGRSVAVPLSERDIRVIVFVGGTVLTAYTVAHALAAEAKAAAGEFVDYSLVADLTAVSDLVTAHLQALSRAAAGADGAPTLFNIMAGSGSALAKRVAAHADVMRGKLASGGRVDPTLAAATLQLAGEAAAHVQRLEEELQLPHAVKPGTANVDIPRPPEDFREVGFGGEALLEHAKAVEGGMGVDLKSLKDGLCLMSSILSYCSQAVLQMVPAKSRQTA